MNATADPQKAADKKGAALMKAMTGRTCDEEACLRLIAEGANTDITDRNGYTLLYYAATAPAPRVFAKLLDRESDIDRRMGSGKMSILFFTAAGGNTEALSLLLACGADVNTVNDRGHTPLMAATMNNHPETVRLLLAAGANPAAKDLNGKTALDHARDMARPDIEPQLAEAMKNHAAMAIGRKLAVRPPLRLKPH